MKYLILIEDIEIEAENKEAVMKKTQEIVTNIKKNTNIYLESKEGLLTRDKIT